MVKVTVTDVNELAAERSIVAIVGDDFVPNDIWHIAARNHKPFTNAAGQVQFTITSTRPELNMFEQTGKGAESEFVEVCFT